MPALAGENRRIVTPWQERTHTRSCTRFSLLMSTNARGYTRNKKKRGTGHATHCSETWTRSSAWAACSRRRAASSAAISSSVLKREKGCLTDCSAGQTAHYIKCTGSAPTSAPPNGNHCPVTIHTNTGIVPVLLRSILQ